MPKSKRMPKKNRKERERDKGPTKGSNEKDREKILILLQWEETIDANAFGIIFPNDTITHTVLPGSCGTNKKTPSESNNNIAL